MMTRAMILHSLNWPIRACHATILHVVHCHHVGVHPPLHCNTLSRSHHRDQHNLHHFHRSTPIRPCRTNTTNVITLWGSAIRLVAAADLFLLIHESRCEKEVGPRLYQICIFFIATTLMNKIEICVVRISQQTHTRTSTPPSRATSNLYSPDQKWSSDVHLQWQYHHQPIATGSAQLTNCICTMTHLQHWIHSHSVFNLAWIRTVVVTLHYPSLHQNRTSLTTTLCICTLKPLQQMSTNGKKANPNSGERVSATCQLLIGQSTSQNRSNGQWNNQLWSNSGQYCKNG